VSVKFFLVHHWINHVQHQHSAVPENQWHHHHNQCRNTNNRIVEQVQTVKNYTAHDNEPHNQSIAEVHRAVKKTWLGFIRHLTYCTIVIGLSEFGAKNTVLKNLAFATFWTFASNKWHNALSFTFHISVCVCIGKKIHPQYQVTRRGLPTTSKYLY
jgi:hypothetical protein